LSYKCFLFVIQLHSQVSVQMAWKVAGEYFRIILACQSGVVTYP
jgi:hypothetical protein